MPPKKSSKKDKSDGINLEVIPPEYLLLTAGQLEAKVNSLTNQLEKSMKDRNFIQLEKDTLQRHFETTQEDVEIASKELLEKEAEIEEIERKNAVELRVYEQKIKHLEYQFKKTQNEIQAQGEASLTKCLQSQKEAFFDLIKKRAQLHQQSNNLSLKYDNQIVELEKSQEDELNRVREEYDLRYREREKDRENRLVEIQKELSLELRIGLEEIEERKNKHLLKIKKQHNTLYNQLKSYNTEVIQDIVQVILSLKQELAMMLKKEANIKAKICSVHSDTSALQAPLEEEQKVYLTLTTAMKQYDKTKSTVLNLTGRKRILEKEMKDLGEKISQVSEKIKVVEREYDDLYRKFGRVVKDAQKGALEKNLALEKRVEHLSQEIMKRQSSFRELLSSMSGRLDVSVVTEISGSIESNLSRRDALIEGARFELHKAIKTYNETLRSMKVVCASFGVGKEKREEGEEGREGGDKEGEILNFPFLPSVVQDASANLVVRKTF